MSLSSLGSGMVQGFAIALVAVGFTVIYNATRVVNFANGQMMVFGAYIGWLVYAIAGLPFFVTVIVTVGAGALLGMVTDRVVIAPLRNASLLIQVMALLALSHVLDGAFLQVFGPRAKSFPAYASTAAVVPGLNWSGIDLVIVTVTSLAVAVLVAFLYFTEIGTFIRATADNAVAASLVGINPRAVAMSAWAIGGAITALGGLLILPKLLLLPTVGPTLTFLAFAAVVLGGFGSLTGAVVGGLLIGIAQAVVGSLLAAGYEPLISLGAMLIVLTVRPTGLVGERV